MEVRVSAHTAYKLMYHVIWVCKYRRRILKPGVCGYIKKLLNGLRSMAGVEIERIGFDKDYLHIVMIIPPKYVISDVIGQLKSQSSSQLRKNLTG